MIGKLYATGMTCESLEGLVVEPFPCSLPPLPRLKKNGDTNTQYLGPKDKACKKFGQGTLFIAL